MAPWILLASYLLLAFSAQTSNGAILLSSLPNTLKVDVSPHRADQVTPGTWYFNSGIKAGEDNLGVLWKLNDTFPSGTDSSYKTVKVKLCFAPVSQVNRPWRKTDDDLSKDKTCQFEITDRPYDASSNWTYMDNTLDPRVPPAFYFVRVYAYGAEGVEVAYGQSDVNYNVFEVSGGSKSTLNMICFSALSASSLVGFFLA